MSERIEALLKEYPKMKLELKCLELQIKNFEGLSEIDMIESLYYNKIAGDRVQKSGLSDKSSNIAIQYKKKLEEINEGWIKQIVIRYVVLNEEIITIESAIEALPDELRNILKDLIINELTWDTIMVKYYICRTMVAKRRKKAIIEFGKVYDIQVREASKYILG